MEHNSSEPASGVQPAPWPSSLVWQLDGPTVFLHSEAAAIASFIAVSHARKGAASIARRHSSTPRALTITMQSFCSASMVFAISIASTQKSVVTSQYEHV